MPKWNHAPDDFKEEYPVEDAPGNQTPGIHRPVSARIKYKAFGYRIEKTINGKRWTLEKYYRNETTMRRSYRACCKRGSGKHSWHPYVYRMVLPGGKILPRAYDHNDHEYRFTLERLNPRDRQG